MSESPRVWHHAHMLESPPKMEESMSKLGSVRCVSHGEWMEPTSVSLVCASREIHWQLPFEWEGSVWGTCLGLGDSSGDFSLRQPRRHSPFLVHWLQLSVNGVRNCKRGLATPRAQRLPWSLGLWNSLDRVRFMREALIAVAPRIIRPEAQWVRELYTCTFWGMLCQKYQTQPVSLLQLQLSSILRIRKRGKYVSVASGSGSCLLYFHFLLPTVFIFATSFFAGVVALKIWHGFFLCV